MRLFSTHSAHKENGWRNKYDMCVRDALSSDLPARISILPSILGKQVTLESSVAGSILIGSKKNNKSDQNKTTGT